MQLTPAQFTKLKIGDVVYGASPYLKMPQKHTIQASWIKTTGPETHYQFESTMKGAEGLFQLLHDADALFTTASEAQEAWKKERPKVLKIQVSNHKFCIKPLRKNLQEAERKLKKLEKELTLFSAKANHTRS